MVAGSVELGCSIFAMLIPTCAGRGYFRGCLSSLLLFKLNLESSISDSFERRNRQTFHIYSGVSFNSRKTRRSLLLVSSDQYILHTSQVQYKQCTGRRLPEELCW